MKKDLLKLLDLSGEDITRILNTADQMKYNQTHGLAHNYLKGKTLARCAPIPVINGLTDFAHPC